VCEPACWRADDPPPRGRRRHRGRNWLPHVPRHGGAGGKCKNLRYIIFPEFYDFPAEHWKHLWTTNPIESTFATVRHRTIRSKGCLSNKTALAMVFKLVDGAQKNWRRIDGHNQLPKLIQGVRFTDGIEVIGNSAAPQPQAAAWSFNPSPKFGDISRCSRSTRLARATEESTLALKTAPRRS
jgi:Transposase, Mutator family